MIRVFIVDDEQRAIDGLKSLLDLFVKDVEVVGESTSVKEAAEKLNDMDIDLLF